MSISVLPYLRHILKETRFLIEFSAGIENDAFLQDEVLQRAFVRSLEIIGEAARHVPDEFRRSRDEVRWANMVGMRDRLVHGYFGIDYEIVWDVITNIIPDLRRDIERLIQSETNE
ncbi:MAG: DUF86 domain-containing protein [Chloroflexi bacterium]|nr:DUF86 domain-containing protein [Chloroflexota bacterium]